MKIALIQCPAFGIDRPPLALGYLAAVLRERNYDVKCFDFNIRLYSDMDEDKKSLWDFGNVYRWFDENYFLQIDPLHKKRSIDWLNEVMSFNPDAVGFSVQTSSLAYSAELAKLIKMVDPAKFVIFGGPITSTHSLGQNAYFLQLENELKTKAVDAVVVGEGELTLIDLLDRFKNKSNLEDCKGTVFIRNSVINNGPGTMVNNLDELPFPDFSDFSLDKYSNKLGKTLPILGSRGCIHKCVFCDDTLIWKKYRFRSAGNIFKEMSLRKAQGVSSLEFNDLLINGDYGQLNELCDLLIGSKPGISWGASASVDKHLDFQMLKKLKSAGCSYLNYGIESASPKVLKDMNKGFSIEEALRVIQDSYKARIKACTNWIVGFPTETDTDFQETLSFVRNKYKLIKDGLMVNSFMIKDHSLLHSNLDKYGIEFDQDHKWKTQEGGNTEEIRRKRYVSFLEEVNKLNGSIAHKNFYS